MEDDLIDNYDHATPDIFYVPTCIPGKGCDLNLFESSISTHCDCSDQPNCANSTICPCLQSTGPNYRNGLLVDDKLLESSGTLSVVECNPHCDCSSSCSNRLVQLGPNPDLVIMDAGAKGHGIVCKSPLRKGQFVCEYAGEIIGELEASERRKNDHNNYIFVLNEFVSNDKLIKTTIDATCIGNIGRYINHSCNPNCIVVPVRVDSFVPRLAIFAKRTIPAGEEITYRYSESGTNGGRPCLCGEMNCAKYLPGCS